MAMRIVMKMVRLQNSRILDGEIMMVISTEGVLDIIDQTWSDGDVDKYLVRTLR